MWKLQPPGILWACPGLQWGCFTMIFLSIFLGMRNISDKFVKKMKTHTLCSENRAVYEIMWKIMAKSDKPQMAIQCGAWAMQAR
jgi:hypothetical protein